MRKWTACSDCAATALESRSNPDVLALSGGLPVEQRRQHGDRAVHSAQQVGDGHADGRGAAFGGRVHCAEAADRLGEHVLAGETDIGAVGSVAGGRCVHDGRFDRHAILVAQAQPVHDAGAEVLVDDVAECDQPPRDIDTLGRLQIQRQ